MYQNGETEIPHGNFQSEDSRKSTSQGRDDEANHIHGVIKLTNLVVVHQIDVIEEILNGKDDKNHLRDQGYRSVNHTETMY